MATIDLEWHALPPVPDDYTDSYYDGSSLTYLNGKLYLVPYRGGSMKIFTIATNSWALGPTIPFETYDTSTGMVVGDVIWYGCDEVGENYQAGFFSYDTANNTFSTPVTWNRNGNRTGGIPGYYWYTNYKQTIVRVANYLYFAADVYPDAGDTYGLGFLKYNYISGDVSFTSLGSHEIYDFGFTAIDTKIYVANGYQRYAHWNDVIPEASATSKDIGVMQIYDTETDTWSFSQKLDPQPREDPVCFARDGKIWVIGGGNGDNQYDPGYAVPWISTYDVATDEWTVENDLDQARDNPAMAVGEDKLFVLGGYGNDNDPELSFAYTNIAPPPPGPDLDPDIRQYNADTPTSARYFPVPR